MAQKAKSRRPTAARAAALPQSNGTNGSNGKNGSHKADAQPPLLGKDHLLASVMGAFNDDPF